MGPPQTLGLVSLTLPLSFLQIFGQASLIPQLFSHEQQVSMEPFSQTPAPESRVRAGIWPLRGPKPHSLAEMRVEGRRGFPDSRLSV